MLFRKSLIVLFAMVLISSALCADPVDSSAQIYPTKGDPWQEYFPQGLIDREGKPVSLDVLKGKIVGIYFSAHWCPSCQEFSPKLVPFRNLHSSEFEVVFVSSDKSEAAQFVYMKEYEMLWPTLKFQSPPAFALKKKFEIKTIPTLIVLSPTGELITREGRYDVQTNPEGALEKWKGIHGLKSPEQKNSTSPDQTRSSDGPSALLSSLDRQVISEVNTLRPPPKKGFVTGTVGIKQFSVTLDRTAWTFTGTAGEKPFDIKIDHQAGTIRGSAHDSGVDLTFKWSPEEAAFDGEAYGYPYWVNINWDGKTANGGIGCSMLEMNFDLQNGTLDGDLGGKKTSLKYDEVSGRLTGELFKRPVDLKLVNLDLSDFIQHLYLFIR